MYLYFLESANDIVQTFKCKLCKSSGYIFESVDYLNRIHSSETFVMSTGYLEIWN